MKLFKDLVNKKFYIEIGSGTVGGIWNEDRLTQEIEEAIMHNLFDYDFHANWIDNGDEYKNIFYKYTLKPMLNNLDKTLSEMFTFKGNKLTFNIVGIESEAWIDNWFKTNKYISKSLKQKYYDYRYKYAWVKLL